MLLPVLPHLGPELQVENEAKRLAAVELLGRLFSRPGSGGMLREYAELFQDLLKRLHDQKVRLFCWFFLLLRCTVCSDCGLVG